MSEPKYRMTVDLNVLEHLGINLYSNIAAVLTEAVANAWDADAKRVDITIDKATGRICIADDGMGMSVQDMNDKYLHVGYRRRIGERDKTPMGRFVMGRKGLGKLSLFSIAQIIEVQSAKGRARHGLTMNLAEIEKALRANKTMYLPRPMESKYVKVKKGTAITLTDIKKHVFERSIVALRTQLARRFSVIGERFDFKVVLNGSVVGIEDRCELQKAQFVWRIGDGEMPKMPSGCKILEQHSIQIPSNGKFIRLKGWVATAYLPKDLETDAGNMNGIVVMARGRLIQEDILVNVNDGRMYTTYLTGQIEADVLDDTDDIDIATSDRQRMKEDDPRYLKLIDTVKFVLSVIESEWTGLRKKYEVARVKKEIPEVREWLDEMRPGVKENAEKMIAQISSFHVENEGERKILYKHGILAFERMRLRGSESEFVQGISKVERLLELLSDRDALEAELYRDIVRSRLEAIRHISELVDADKKEKVLQEYLFNHLWLLDTTWERATGSERMEQALKKEFREFSEDLTDEESKGRLDIRYKTSAGSHIIVELKRYKRPMTLPELQEQGGKYRSALGKCLAKQGKVNPDIQIVFVLGRPVAEENDPAFGPQIVRDMLKSMGARIVYYDEMIVNAQKAYSEYAEKEKAVNKLDKVLQALDNTCV